MDHRTGHERQPVRPVDPPEYRRTDSVSCFHFPTAFPPSRYGSRVSGGSDPRMDLTVPVSFPRHNRPAARGHPEEEGGPLTEREMLEELKLFAENLMCDCSFITHHTISGVNLSGPDFLARKEKIAAALEHQIHCGDMDRMAAFRRNKRTL